MPGFNPKFSAEMTKDGHKVVVRAQTQRDLDAEVAYWKAKGYAEAE